LQRQFHDDRESARPNHLIRRYRSLTAEQELVYGLIDEAGDDGIWSKTIKARSNLHDAVFRTAIKHLEAKSMISDMKSVEHPTRKMYIKSSVRPSDRATGGPWYSDGELDEEFISMMMTILYEHIKKRTFYHSSSGGALKKPKKVKKLTPEETKALRDKSLGPRVKTEEVEDERTLRKRKFDSFLPMPAGYQAYPTLDDLTAYVENSRFTSQTLSANEVEQLLEIMCYDERIERIVSGPEGVAYRALRTSLKPEEDRRPSVLTEAPCGRCPVFDLCEEGGPVGPSNCEYFTDWLGL
jgi:DNA-directed RNA polymerase III subunit RPC6